jgi:transmembrane sensor
MSRFSHPSQAVASPPVDEAADVRELAAYVPTGDAVDQQAAAWLVRSQRGLDAAQADALQAWLAAQPAHRQAFERHQALWADLDALPADSKSALKAGLSAAGQHEARWQAPAPPSRALRRTAWWPHTAVAALVLAVAGAGWLGWGQWVQQPTFAKQYATARGQQLGVKLPDGSRVFLDTATEVDVSLYLQRRELRLPQGQVMLHVQADPQQPFEVLAGPVRITVVGTRFSVRHRALEEGQAGANGGVHVAVEQGQVRVTRATAADGIESGGHASAAAGDTVVLTAGQMVEADATGALGPVGVVAAASVAPWREGRLSFNETPLSLALSEFERYGRTGLRIDDPAVGRLALTGSFDVRKVDGFAVALTRALPVRLERRDDQTFIVMVR